MKIIINGDVKIDYIDTGRGDTTLLFVHGAFINKEYWDVQIRHFSADHRVIAPDLPGHGESGKNREAWAIQDFGKDITTIIKELNLDNVILIGHSMGGDAILESAVEYSKPISGFIGVDNFKNAGTGLPPEFQNLADAMIEKLKVDFSDTAEEYARMVLLTEATDASIVARVVYDYRNMDPKIGVGMITSAFSYYDRERELMQKLSKKIYLINVDYSPTNESLIQRYAGSGCKISMMHGTCHFPMIEDAPTFNQLLKDAINEITDK